MQRLVVTAQPDGVVALGTVAGNRPLSSPGAMLKLTNVRTSAQLFVRLNDRGRFPNGVLLSGVPGDVLSVAVVSGADGAGPELGRITVPRPAAGEVDLVGDPPLHKKDLQPDGTPRFDKRRFRGPLFAPEAPRASSVVQGQLFDSYLAAAVAALAQCRPGALRRLVVDHGDGTFTVTFRERDWTSGSFRDVAVKLDGDLYVRHDGAPLYGASAGARDEASMELWWPLLEKGFATWKGGYHAIGSGGSSAEVLEALLGLSATELLLSPSVAGRAWEKLREVAERRWPCCATTHPELAEARAGGASVYAAHSYTVLGCRERDGVFRVELRNPWEDADPHARAGVLELTLPDFCRLFRSLVWAEPSDGQRSQR